MLLGDRCAYLINYGDRYYCYLYKEPNDPSQFPHFGSGCPFPDNPLRRKLRQQEALMPDAADTTPDQ